MIEVNFLISPDSAVFWSWKYVYGEERPFSGNYKPHPTLKSKRFEASDAVFDYIKSLGISPVPLNDLK